MGAGSAVYLVCTIGLSEKPLEKQKRSINIKEDFGVNIFIRLTLS